MERKYTYSESHKMGMAFAVQMGKLFFIGLAIAFWFTPWSFLLKLGLNIVCLICLYLMRGGPTGLDYCIIIDDNGIKSRSGRGEIEILKSEMTRIYQEKEGMRLLGKGDRTIYISYDIDGYKEIIAWMEDALKLKKEPPPVYKIPFEGMDRERAAVRMKQAKIFYIVMICLPLPLWLAALYFNDTRYVTETQPWLFYGLCSLNLLQLFAIWYFDGVSMLDSPQLGIVILSACAYFLINACIAMFGSLQGLHIKSSWGLWGYTLLLEIFLFLCYLLVSYQVNIPYQQKFAFFIFYGLCFLWGGYYMIYYTNNALDKSSPVSYTGIIVDKHIELGKGSLKKYYIKVKWKEKSVEEFWILNAQYDKMPVSYKIEVRERPGLLNIPWMEFFDPATGKKL